MAKYEEQNQLDYRLCGDTVDDFAQKYMREITRIFRFLNDLRSNTTNNIEYTEPVAGQIKIEDGKFYIRDTNNAAWVYIGDIAVNFGFKPANAEFLSTSDLTKEKISTINDVDFTKVLTEDNISLSKVDDINSLDFNKVITSDDLGNVPGKIPVVGNDNLLDVSVSGSAAKLADYLIKTFDIKDGQALMYSASLKGWTNQDVSVIGMKVEYDEAGDIMPGK